MNATLMTKMAEGVVEAVRAYVDQRETLLLKRIDELERREPIPGPAGKDSTVDVKALADDLEGVVIQKVLAQIPIPKDGNDGKDGADGVQGVAGKDASFDLESVVAEVVKAIPVPKDGINGKDGKDGESIKGDKGDPGEIDMELIRLAAAEVLPGMVERSQAMLQERIDNWLPDIKREAKGDPGEPGKDAEPIDVDAIIKSVVAQIPVPKDGAPGKDAAEIDPDAIVAKVLALVPVARDGKDGRDGKDADEKEIIKEVLEKIPPPLPGRDGMPGANGASGINGKDGINGRDGTDAFSLEDLSIEQLKDGRTVRFKFQSGERVLQKDIRFDVPLYRRTYMREGLYEKDDMVTYHNEVWIAIQDKPTEPPGALSKQWQLAIRKGRDSKPVKI